LLRHWYLAKISQIQILITHFLSQQQCPDSSWIKSSPKANATVVTACENIKSFIKDCHTDIPAMEAFFEHQKD